MKLPKGKTVYSGGNQYKGEVPDKVFDSIKPTAQEKLTGKRLESKPKEKLGK